MLDPKTVEESYISASNTSDLRVEADKRNAADVLIAAGWTPGVMGNALMRLRSEWDGCARPARPTQAQILVIAASLPREIVVKGETIKRSDKDLIRLAREEAQTWYRAELQLLRVKLKSIRKCQELVTDWAQEKAKNPEKFACKVVSYWLDNICHACHGRGHLVIEGAPVLGEECPVCRGSGRQETPAGQLGREALAVMDECVMTARNAMKKRLRKG